MGRSRLRSVGRRGCQKRAGFPNEARYARQQSRASVEKTVRMCFIGEINCEPSTSTNYLHLNFNTSSIFKTEYFKYFDVIFLIRASILREIETIRFQLLFDNRAYR